MVALLSAELVEKKGVSSMKKVFLTFGDGGENFIAARRRVADEAAATGQFDEIVECGLEAVSEEMRKSPLMQYSRGCGYWAWKPDIILSALSRLQFGDVVVWSDAGNVINKAPRQWKKFFKMLGNCDMIFKKISSCALQWHRKELLEFFPTISGRQNLCFICEGSAMIFKKTPLSMKVVTEWRNFMLLHPECVRDVLSEDERLWQLPSFRESRHDQSVLTLIICRYLDNAEAAHKIARIKEFHVGGWLLGDPCISVVRNRSGTGYRLPFKSRLSRVGLRVLYRFQSLLENHGVQLCWWKLSRGVGG